MTVDEAIAYVRKTYWKGGAGNVLANEVERLRAENAELRELKTQMLDALRKSAAAVRDYNELEWFRRAWPMVEAIKAATNLHAEALATLVLQEWEEINPKPGAKA